ncbi:unnamed protein product [Pleuronectes platessa]|uniref:Uncharacterized protein n=1 Tax=Pleuronectes platessa TaxID=8262 RepID=A0A9N7V574_PLEPL|nr:unnamed protein product [Pleuronectes platessa]
MISMEHEQDPSCPSGRRPHWRLVHLSTSLPQHTQVEGKACYVVTCLFQCKNIDTEANTSMGQTVMGVYVIHKVGAEPKDEPEDIGVLIEGEEVLSGLGNIVIACALLFGLIYCLNLSYPPELKCTFEVLQKILLNLDGQRLSSKARFLKNKLLQ